MSLIDDLLELARQALPTDPAAMRAALPGYEAALARLDAIRSTAAAERDNLLRERRELLLEPGAAAAAKIRQIDQRADELDLDLERADEVETALINHCRHLATSVKGSEAAEIADLYKRAARLFCIAMSNAVAARERLVEVRNIAVRSGLEQRLPQLELPHTNFPLVLERIAQFEQGAMQTAAHLKALPAKTEVFPIKFHAMTGQYRSGEVAGFDAATAWRLVDAGVAQFADPTKRPPRPAYQGKSQ